MTKINRSARLRHAVANGRESGDVWTFETKRFAVTLSLTRQRGYRYDGDDEDGATQRALDSGEFVAFDSTVTVELDGEEIAFDSLGGSVYKSGECREFWTAHRDADAMNRNCSAMRATHGNVSICHYFPSMVSEAISAARSALAKRLDVPRLRTNETAVAAPEPVQQPTPWLIGIGQPEPVQPLAAIVKADAETAAANSDYRTHADFKPLRSAIATAAGRLPEPVQPPKPEPVRTRPLYVAMANAAQARKAYEKMPGNSWFHRWTDRLEHMAKEFLPSGSGFDSGTQIDLDASDGEKLTFRTSFHHMNEAGFYDGWTEHIVTIRSSLSGEFRLSISGRDRNGFKDYAAELFDSALRQPVTQQQEYGE